MKNNSYLALNEPISHQNWTLRFELDVQLEAERPISVA